MIWEYKHYNELAKAVGANRRYGQTMLCFNPSSGEWTNLKASGSYLRIAWGYLQLVWSECKSPQRPYLDLDCTPNLISSSCFHPGPLYINSLQFIHNFLSNVANKHTNQR